MSPPARRRCGPAGGSVGLALFFLCALLAPAGGLAQGTARVEEFSPEGVVKGVRQASARFSEPMVPLGDPRTAVSPFEIDCPEAATGRWVDSQRWVYDFAHELPGGVRCRFRIRPGLRSLAGGSIEGRREFSFSTGGPAIISSLPWDGNESIEEEQAFVLALDAGPTEESVLARAAFSVEGLPERIGVRLLDPEARQAIVAALAEWARPKGPYVVLQARQRFPSAARISLVWGAGIRSETGVETTEDQVLQFKTRPTFTAKFFCEKLNPRAGCIPLTPMRVRFSAPVARDVAGEIAIVGPDGRRRKPEAPDEPSDFVWQVEFRAPFPEAAELTVEVPPGLRDDAGRTLANASRFPLTVKTDPFPPLAKFSARFGIVEWKADPVLPVTLRNLEPEVTTTTGRIAEAPTRTWAERLEGFVGEITGRSARVPPDHPEAILPWLRRVAVARRERSVFEQAGELTEKQTTFKLPKPGGPDTFEVVGIPLPAPGFYVVELESPRLGAALLGKDRPMYVPTAVLVTNLSVHLKWGRESSLVWVTGLDNALPVGGADVSVQNCRGEIVARARTDGDGLARFTDLPAATDLPDCRAPRTFASFKSTDYADYYSTPALGSLDSGLFVVAQTDGDLGFVHSSWSQGIEAWRFRLPSGGSTAPLLAHTIFDRLLFRAGETVHMKHILRVQRLDGLILADDAERPSVATIRHRGSNDTHDLSLEWNASGSAESAWTIPAGAKLGSYDVLLKRPDRADELRAGTFRVEEFRVPLMRATLGLPARPQVAPTAVSADIAVQYLAGGGAAKLAVTLRSQIAPGGLDAPEGFTDLTFGNGEVREGLERRSDAGEEAEASADAGTMITPLAREELVLDAAGSARATVRALPPSTALRRLTAEIEFRDPNGEIQTVSSSVPLWPAANVIGLEPEHWAGAKNDLTAQVAVLDTERRPVAGAAVRVEAFSRRTYSNRKRLVGGFYAYEHIEETRALGTLCAGQTDARGRFGCEAPAPADGQLILQATTHDSEGRPSVANRDVWVAGNSDWRFSVDASDRIDLLPEKPRYEPGETARLQLRMPFRQATALVTAEREGVLDARVVSLRGNEPVVELPVRGAYAPNVFVSVLAVRGRVGEPPPGPIVDLGKPAFKLGIAELRVGWRDHELAVKISTERDVYRVRETARVDVAVETPEGGPPPPGSEVAIAAVDEGLLELAPNGSWDLLDAMMVRRAYGVRNATAQLQVVGKRHYGRKALPTGGGGGRRGTRELFDTLLLWRGRLPLDEHGRASVEIPLNDSLTSFRIVAVAAGGADRFGTGSTRIRSTQDLMLLSGLPPLVREGDEFRAGFTLRNTTEDPVDVTIVAKVAGLAQALPDRQVHLAGGGAETVSWDVVVPSGVDGLAYDVGARAATGASDRLRVTQEVKPAVPVRPLQATLLRWDEPVALPVERPAEALADRGGIDVGVAASLGAGLDGVRAWMRDYPYVCLEQKVSRAVALGDDGLWNEVASALPGYLDADGLLKYFPTMASGSEVLTAYVLSISQAAGRSIPESVRERAVKGLKAFVAGTVLRSPALATADLSIRKLAAIEALARHGAADASLVTSIALEPNLWPTSALLDWWSILARVDGIPRQPEHLSDVERILRARLSLQGTVLTFSTERSDGWWWLMASADANAARLVLHLLEQNAWQDRLPRLMRGALSRQRRGAWESTVANAWGTLAVERFVASFEATPPTGVTTATLDPVSRRFEWGGQSEATLGFPWPAGPGSLVLEHDGGGHPWLLVSARAAVPLREALASGYRVSRTVTPIEPRTPGRLSVGDRLLVRLDIDAQTDMTWVVVSDPLPAGASHLGSGLGRGADIGTPGGSEDERPPSFAERSFAAYRAYYEFVPAGRLSLSYAIRLNQSGRFNLPPTRVEALYAAEVYGELPCEPMKVDP